MLQSVEMRCSLSQSLVTDSWAVAEGQAGKAAAVPRYRRQAGVCDLREHGEGETLEVWVTHHLRSGKPGVSPDVRLGIPPPKHTHLRDAAVSELGTCGQVELLQPAES